MDFPGGRAVTVPGGYGGAEQGTALRRFASLMALKHTPDGRFFAGHWQRGPVLYGLVQRYQPRNVLEFGTGRGFGAACMAKAAVDAGIDCTVWTIDRIAPDERQAWALDEGRGPEVREASLAEVWNRHLPGDVRSRIRCLTGDSLAVMRAWITRGLPRVQFCYIDGGHDYWTVKHDFIAALRIADRGCTLLFDDYAARPGYGVKRLVDEEIRPPLPTEAVEVIDVVSRDRAAPGQDAPHEMALVRGEYLDDRRVAQFYTDRAVRAFGRRFTAVRQFRRIMGLARGARQALRRV